MQFINFVHVRVTNDNFECVVHSRHSQIYWIYRYIHVCDYIHNTQITSSLYTSHAHASHRNEWLHLTICFRPILFLPFTVLFLPSLRLLTPALCPLCRPCTRLTVILDYILCIICIVFALKSSALTFVTIVNASRLFWGHIFYATCILSAFISL